jgi:16S rRNA (cytidine1402-2'-O)-methyltransferase
MGASLFLIPVTLGETECRRVLPDYNREVIMGIRHFIVEDIRASRRFLKRLDPLTDIDSLAFYPLNKHTSAEEAQAYLDPIGLGEDVGVISEAGCPAIADPGADMVALAQRRGYPVIPLVGPSSIVLSLMASGFNGQSFAFNGYLPVDAEGRLSAIRKMEGRIYAESQTQIFIETPYRNNRTVEDIIRICRPSTLLCIASGLTCTGESVRTLPVKAWEGKAPDLNRIPTIFLIYK